MTQLDPARYKKLTVGSTYGSDDGLYHDTTNDQICVVLGDTILTRFDATGMAGDLEFTSEANGDILRRVSDVWEALSANSAGNVVIGDGTNVISAALGGDVDTVSAAGVVALADPQKIHVATVTLTPTTIAGNSAGDLGHADGVTLVAAEVNKVIHPVACVINYTYGVAAYTDGGNLTAGYKDGGAITGLVAAATSLGAAAKNINVLAPVSGAALSGKALVLRSSAAFTAAGGQTGTAEVKVYYRLLTAINPD